MVPVISEIEISPLRTVGSTWRVTWSPRPSTAHPKKSKPGPKFATVAGAKVLTEVKTGSGSVTMTRLCDLYGGSGFKDRDFSDYLR